MDTSKSGTVTLSGTNVVFARVPILSGERLSNLAACTTSSGVAAVATHAIRELYKVVVIPGAAAFLAGVLLNRGTERDDQRGVRSCKFKRPVYELRIE